MILNSLGDMDEPLTSRKLCRIVAAHGKLVNLIAPQLTGKKATSFCSKYMHFHKALVPIYDSRGVDALKRLFRGQRVGRVEDHADQNYQRFACRFWKAYDELDRQGKNPKVKLVDWWLNSSNNTPEY